MSKSAQKEKFASDSLLKANPLLALAVKAAFKESKPALDTIEAHIYSHLHSEAPALTEISEYLVALGGKRIRPLLTVLTSKLFKMKEPSQAVIDTAAGIELIHMATLLHDDIIDQSPTRRRKTSAFKHYGLTPTLLAGDFLLVRAFGLCAHLDIFIVEETEKACVALTEGEVLEGTISEDYAAGLDEYETIVRKKTASLFELACVSGAFLADADTTSVELLRSFGRNAGIAFQMVDDILDITADEDLLGKPAGTDLKQKTPSLVNILWLESGDPNAREFFQKPSPTIEEAKQAVAQILKTNTIAESRKRAVHFANKANSALHTLSIDAIDAKARDQLTAIIEYTLERCL